MAQVTVRLPDDLARQLQQAVAERGYGSASALIRLAVQNELREREPASAEIEDRIAGSLNRLARDLRSVHTANQATFALVDALVKVVLTCIPEPPPDIAEQAKSRAKRRYEKFLVSAAQGMAGDSKGSLAELSRGDH